jgi:hypothetical protein
VIAVFLVISVLLLAIGMSRQTFADDLKSPTTIKELDTVKVDAVFPELISNTEKEAVFVLDNRLNQPQEKTNLKFRFIEVCGHVNSYQLKVLENRTINVSIPQSKIETQCWTKHTIDNKLVLDSKTGFPIEVCEDVRVLLPDKVEQKVIEDYYPVESIKSKKQQYKIDADKRQYNSLQMGYIAGFDFDNYLSNRFSLNTSIMASYVSQLENFPLFNSQYQRPRQLSTFFSIGIKVRF